MTLTAFDVVMLAVLVVIVIKVTMSGFIAEFFSMAAVILGAVGAVAFYRLLTPFVSRYIGDGTHAYAVSFLLLFLAIYLVVKIVQKIVWSATENETVDNLDHALGFFLGIVEGLLFIVVVLIILRSIPWFDLSFVTKDSFIARYLNPVAIGVPGAISGFLPKLH